MNTTTKRIGGIPSLAGPGTTAITVSEPDPMNVSTEMFHEIPVRIVRTERGPAIPIADIADAIGYDRTTLLRLVNRNEESFVDYKGLVKLTTPGGIQEMAWLTRDGIIGLILMINLKYIKDPARKQRIKEYRRWAIETLGKVMDGIPVQAPRMPANSLPEIMDQYLITAERFAQVTGIPKNEVIEVALRVIEAKTGEDLVLFKDLLNRKPEPIVVHPIVPEIPKWDPLRDFLNECCQQGNSIFKSELYSAYVKWCGIYRTPLSTKRFSGLMREHGFRSGSVYGGRRTWEGIDLKEKIKEVELR